jgi:anti-sigma factor RsiW
MQCHQIQERLSAALDGELSAAERADVDQHLAGCATCRAELSALESLDRDLRRGTVALRARAPHIAAAVTAQHSPTLSTPNGRLRFRTALIAVVGMACGFLLALLLLNTSREAPTPRNDTNVPPVAVHAPPVPPAIIRVATGPVEVAADAPAEWTTVAQPDGFACRPGVAVRTLAATVCEIETASGATVRMNAATQLAFVDANDVQFSQGEIWCRTPDACDLKVTPALDEPAAHAPVSLVLGPRGCSCSFSCSSPTAGARISVASGQIEIVSPSHSTVIPAGRSVEFRNGAIEPAASGGDVASARWMHPLLIRKGPNDSELTARVNALLAEVGRSKLSYLRERDLRSLGEYGALPLLRFLQSTTNNEDAERRQTAASILADIAPAWMIPELIDLLDDADPTVRVSAATALKRLTAQTLGIEPQSWAESDRDLQPSIAQWRTWWESERQAYPTPPPGVTL